MTQDKTYAKLSVVILTKNSELSLERTLKSVEWVDEIIIIDQESSDKTIKIAKKHNSICHISNEESFSVRRDLGMQKAKNDWLLYIDSDEIIPNELKYEILTLLKSNKIGAYGLVRENYFLGTKMYPDVVERLFHKHILSGWRGEVHETPVYTGEMSVLDSYLIHHTHIDIQSMLDKTNEWSEIEAQLRMDANHPPVKWWRLVRMSLTVLWSQFVDLKLFRFGRSGLFEGYFQMIDKLIVYTKLWEKQKSDDI